MAYFKQIILLFFFNAFFFDEADQLKQAKKIIK